MLLIIVILVTVLMVPLAVSSYFEIRIRRCPKCGALMRKVETIMSPIQSDHPQYQNWIEEFGCPTDNVDVLKCPKCGCRKERREPVRANSP